jgi:hypothetical protein
VLLAQSSVNVAFSDARIASEAVLRVLSRPCSTLRFLAVALTCLLAGLHPAGAADPTGNVTVVVANQGPGTIYVAFTNYVTQQPGQINWGNCAASVSNNQVAIATGGTCTASVPNNVGPSRFCASPTAVATPNCNNAQANHQTMVETNFGSGAASTCYPTSMTSCVWYDISLIPQTCTDAAWAQNQCASTGGAAYNLPVSIACSGQPAYTCQGPPGPTYGNSNYPTRCGNPNATCVGNTQSCVNAYFFPMFSGTPSQHQPNSQCPSGTSLVITFLSGQ